MERGQGGEVKLFLHSSLLPLAIYGEEAGGEVK